LPSRRDFLKAASAAALAAGVAPSLPLWAGESLAGESLAACQAAIPIPGKDGMIVRSYRFLDLEMPVEYMTDWITPVNHFFVRNHMFPPDALDAQEWELTITGEVEKPLTLTAAELQKMPVHSVTNTLECAGTGAPGKIQECPESSGEKVRWATQSFPAPV